MSKQTLKAVHDDDLEELLKSLGLYSDFMHGKLKCAFCKQVITWDNLHSLFPDSGQIKCTCANPSCVALLMARRETIRGTDLREPATDNVDLEELVLS